MSDLPKSQKIDIELPEDVADGEYANLAIITHSHAEFIIDFINMMPGVPKARVKSRIILTPTHAKRLLKALAENIKKFEMNFGEINDADPMPPNIPQYPMGGTMGEA